MSRGHVCVGDALAISQNGRDVSAVAFNGSGGYVRSDELIGNKCEVD